MNTDAGAPPAQPARGRGRAGDASGRRALRGVGYADMQARGGEGQDALHGRTPGRGTKHRRMRAEEGLTGAPRSGLWLDGEESAEGALEADLLCCARRTDHEEPEEDSEGAAGRRAEAREALRQCGVHVETSVRCPGVESRISIQHPRLLGRRG
jgi:hypothetical protein